MLEVFSIDVAERMLDGMTLREIDELDRRLAATRSQGLAGDDEYEKGLRFQDMERKDQVWLLAAVMDNLEKVKTISKYENSYKLKHVFEDLSRTGYISNLQMKVAMTICGFDQNKDMPNPSYNVSKKSVDRLKEMARS